MNERGKNKKFLFKTQRLSIEPCGFDGLDVGTVAMWLLVFSACSTKAFTQIGSDQQSGRGGKACLIEPGQGQSALERDTMHMLCSAGKLSS